MTEPLAARLFAPLALTALAALGILLWVLLKGDLCPGQRRRISDGLMSVWAVFGLSLMLAVEANIPAWLLWWGGLTLVLGLGAVLYQARLSGKRSVSLRWHLPACVLSLGLLVWLVVRVGPSGIFMAGAGGCMFAHLIMVRAKHRLQAFNLLLPLVGIGCALGVVLIILGQTLWLQQQFAFDTHSLILPFVQLCAALLLGAVVWLLPLLRKEAPAPPVLAVATLLILGTLTIGQSIIWEVSRNIS